MTTDHQFIRRWVETRNGRPTTVKTTEGSSAESGILPIDFLGYSGAEALQEISWDEWFKKFEEAKLAFLYQEETADGCLK